MDLSITHQTRRLRGVVQLPLSKSILNRYLLLYHMGGGLKPALSAYPLAEDSRLMYSLLWEHRGGTYHCSNAGTVCRFLTAYFATMSGTQVIDGNERMRQRPIAPLVEALRQQGAQIDYLDREGRLPIAIHRPQPIAPPPLLKLPHSLSSQFFSALALTGCRWPEGLRLHVPKHMVSMGYFHMSLQALAAFSIPYKWEGAILQIPSAQPQSDVRLLSSVPADWSAAAFVYGLAALSHDADIYLPHLSIDDSQGDAIIRQWATHWGVYTEPMPEGCRITKPKNSALPPTPLRFDLRDTPDLFPVLAVLCAASGRSCIFEGIAHLRYKESDRIHAVRQGLSACGVPTRVETNRFYIEPSPPGTSHAHPVIDTYDDHRIAMAFTLWAMRHTVTLRGAECVRKSFPQWFDQCRKLGFVVTILSP